MRPQRIPPQGPETSPTFQASTNPVRRNLFSAHLSRRPASNQTQSQPQFPTQPRPEPDDEAFFHSQPQLQPTQPDFSDIYDPTISPHRTLSPSTSAALFPSSSIIAVHPVTGRPILPTMPTLPAHLRLSDSDPPSDSDENHNGEEHAHEASRQQFHSDNPDPYGSEARYDTLQRYTAADEELEEKMDRERIEKTLQEMMSRQRQRVAKVSGRNGLSDEAERSRAHEDVESREEMEREELMSLIVASLRRKVQQADEENWMFGGQASVAGVEDLGYE